MNDRTNFLSGLLLLGRLLSMERELTIADAARTLADVVSRAERGEEVALMRDGYVVARIVPAEKPSPCKTGAELARWWNDPSRLRLSPAEAEVFASDVDAARGQR